MSCGRCQSPLTEAAAEFCWFCLGSLCASDWDTYGHCGHAGAELLEYEQATGARDGLPLESIDAAIARARRAVASA